MRFFLFLLLFNSLESFSQPLSFPQSWTGHWKGQLSWYKGNAIEPSVVPMELSIQPTDSAHRFTWQISYGPAQQDTRPYTLIAKDTARGHWVIDENNGIILDQYWIANKLCGAFTVKGTTILNNYWIEKDQLHIEFYNLSVTPSGKSGLDTEDSPSVSSFPVRSYQKAILQRSK